MATASSSRAARLQVLLAVFAPAAARAGADVSTDLGVRWTAWEQAEHGIREPGRGGLATQAAAGFALTRGRLRLDWRSPGAGASGRLHVRLERRLALLDAWAGWSPCCGLTLRVWQMKVPSTWEALQDAHELDFLARSLLASRLTDWSLSRTPYFSASYGQDTFHRDVGVALSGAWGPVSAPSLVHVFAMVGNGLGANTYLGGSDDPGFFVTNDVGAYFHGLRVEVEPWPALVVGGHGSWNRHSDVLLHDRRTVYDLARASWSADARLTLPWLRAAVLAGGGRVEDEFFQTDQSELAYSGWTAQAMVRPGPAWLEMGARVDAYREDPLVGHASEQRNVTVGLVATPSPGVRLLADYVHKTTDHPTDPDLGDDVLALALLVRWSAALGAAAP